MKTRTKIFWTLAVLLLNVVGAIINLPRVWEIGLINLIVISIYSCFLVKYVRENLLTHTDEWSLKRLGAWLDKELPERTDVMAEIDWDEFEKQAELAIKAGHRDPAREAMENCLVDRPTREQREFDQIIADAGDMLDVVSAPTDADVFDAPPDAPPVLLEDGNVIYGIEIANEHLKHELYSGRITLNEAREAMAFAKQEMSLASQNPPFRPPKANRSLTVDSIRREIWERRMAVALYSDTNWFCYSRQVRRQWVLEWAKSQRKIPSGQDIERIIGRP
jgi:hypothetical protein